MKEERKVVVYSTQPEVVCNINYFLLLYFIIMFVSLHFSVLSLCKVNQLKQTKLRRVAGNLYVHIPELYSVLYWGEACWSHCVKRGAFMPCIKHCSMVTSSVWRECAGMFWLENSKCCCSIVSPHHRLSHSLETQFQGNPGLVVCLTWALLSLSVSFCFVSHAVNHSKPTLSWNIYW